MKPLIRAIVVVLTVLAPLKESRSSTCPDVDLSDTKVSAATKTAMSAIFNRIAELALGANFVRERNSILIQVPNADQVVVTLVFYESICNLIVNSDLPLEKQIEMLAHHQEQLFQRVPYAPIATTKSEDQSPDQKATPLPPLPSINGKATLGEMIWLAAAEPPSRPVQSAEERLNQCLGMLPLEREEDKDQICNCLHPSENVSEDAITEEFLPDRPLVVTEANNYFVVVSSAPSSEAAIDEMHRLKRMAPQYDFAVYAPYGDNPNYGIMMAAWTSRTVAQQALALAWCDLGRRDAFLWKCRQEGSTC